MPKIITVREMTEHERREIERLSRSRTAEHRLVQRASIVYLRSEGTRPAAVAQQLGIRPDLVSVWVKRFNAEGIAGLQDRPGRGRKETYSEAARSIMVEVAKTDPQHLDLPFSCWSLDRLTTYLTTERGIPISRAHLARILEAEGLKWYQEQTYFTERPDPQFAEKRGRL